MTTREPPWPEPDAVGKVAEVSPGTIAGATRERTTAPPASAPADTSVVRADPADRPGEERRGAGGGASRDPPSRPDPLQPPSRPLSRASAASTANQASAVTAKDAIENSPTRTAPGTETSTRSGSPVTAGRRSACASTSSTTASAPTAATITKTMEASGGTGADRR
ncbi:hypothetical protein CMMCAS02_07225 [Clavibacter michiganensis subsp. michiganensis]|nr:hypothetical protein CMMCAS02_07225 [Clavibacter michiganensis subsp. michiganensis]